MTNAAWDMRHHRLIEAAVKLRLWHGTRQNMEGDAMWGVRHQTPRLGRKETGNMCVMVVVTNPDKNQKLTQKFIFLRRHLLVFVSFWSWVVIISSSEIQHLTFVSHANLLQTGASYGSPCIKCPQYLYWSESETWEIITCFVFITAGWPGSALRLARLPKSRAQ